MKKKDFIASFMLLFLFVSPLAGFSDPKKKSSKNKEEQLMEKYAKQE
jgi:hypothetical protein